MSSDSPHVLTGATTAPAPHEPPTPARTGAPPPGPAPATPPAAPPPTACALDRLNAAGDGAAEAALLACCGSRRWARRLATHRPYPDLATLLAAADRASHDLTPRDLTEALADESVAQHALSGSRGPGTAAAHTALRAAHAAYESKFGHVFVVCLDEVPHEEVLGHVLAALRARLGNTAAAEREVAADELRRIARGRLAHLAATRPHTP
ncbi:2-oxo-4-hydroxy-4-carboxy-5-ureidoimidazoline decarboxylase [Streptomyces sp. NPDC057702]|uniref:2-oxo-4-hydroxy-4-carboxy-5-ureidoimidazoline decarboxylase n=1 Tax=unclassified Streptomyces TaxID=2593676 RepID=UPI0036C9D7F8